MRPRAKRLRTIGTARHLSRRYRDHPQGVRRPPVAAVGNRYVDLATMFAALILAALAQDEQLAYFDPGCHQRVVSTSIRRLRMSGGLKHPSMKVPGLVEKPIMGLAWREHGQLDPWKRVKFRHLSPATGARCGAPEVFPEERREKRRHKRTPARVQIVPRRSSRLRKSLPQPAPLLLSPPGQGEKIEEGSHPFGCAQDKLLCRVLLPSVNHS